ncbi:MAG: DUF433 domain-containing protein [Planctomycetota bacterium]|jgi:uncharacterized protein (DUF433 family)|nr:DUF433 domain-containing protein [Planctomycetota bacterium]MDP7249253.1 DUF433 domain-containing protein [Planctomycetota bacterium]
MRLEDYFDFENEDEIRLKGSRICIETIVTDYLDGLMAEQIVVNYPSLSLEQVHATITYYLHNRESVDNYLERIDDWSEQRRREQESGQTLPVVDRLRKLRAALAES